jgi:hypothetical protein
MKVTNTQYKLLPNEPTSKLLSTMHGKLPYCMGDIDHEVLIEVYRALLGEGLEVDQEPTTEGVVARYIGDGFIHIYGDSDKLQRNDLLYTHPQPQREPLSELAKLHIIRDVYNKGGHRGDDYELAIIDAIEKAHGIGVEK